VEVVDDGAVVKVVFNALEAGVVDCIVDWVVILVIAVVVVELLHEAKNKDNIQITPLFIVSSLFQIIKI
jgi:hypothetical protein